MQPHTAPYTTVTQEAFEDGLALVVVAVLSLTVGVALVADGRARSDVGRMVAGGVFLLVAALTALMGV